jgi:pimeloyl-ACP methyl ester carboxylesterase/membrane protein DedA with SNARE-associated domain
LETPQAPKKGGRLRWFLFVYGLLLLASHAVRAGRGAPEQIQQSSAWGAFERTTLTLGGGAEPTEPVDLAYFDSGAQGQGASLPVLLLHGSPGSKRDFESLGAALAQDRRVLALDLPGFGDSEHVLPDYSVAAHARYAQALLEQLGIERLHVLGFSMGGGVVLELSALEPERVASISLLSAIGVQELELLGDYHLNHGIHGLQLGALWSLAELLPHFGALDGGLLSLEYARNFYDTDQRPLRAHLSAWNGPLLILHGRDDVLVDFGAAKEHYRLVPQSEMEVYEANHFMVFSQGELLAERMRPFLTSAEGAAPARRSGAEAGRMALSLKAFDPNDLDPLAGFALVLVLFLIVMGTLVSEDLTCIATGALVAQGRLEFFPGAMACFVGIYIGDLMLFVAGRFLGRRALGSWPLRSFLSAERVEHCSRWFQRKGPMVIFLSRFMPGMRLPTYFAAGVLRTGFLRFSGWFFLAAALWTPILVWLSSKVGGALNERVDLLQRNLLWTLLATLLAGYLLVKFVRPMFTYRGRRLLLAAWVRKVRWEYWPRLVFYPPVILRVLWHGIRSGQPLAFTAVNPAMPHGGFVGESKGDILQGLSAAPGYIAATLRIPAETALEQRIELAREFGQNFEQLWPLVVKPDVGQRGDLVHVVRSEAELRAALDSIAGDVLVQEFIRGPEYGLFYARHPEAELGELRSLTRKELPSVLGDGRRNLEQLVLEDDRARCMAHVFLAKRLDADQEIPAAGERVSLGDLGTHSLGAAFLDGGALESPELLAALDELADAYPGFHFGRFDVRAESEAALQAGNFRILELNGVTAEESHIYDPSYGVFYAWRTITAQWCKAIDIGRANAKRGAKVTGLLGLIAAGFDYRRLSRGQRLRGDDRPRGPQIMGLRGAEHGR